MMYPHLVNTRPWETEDTTHRNRQPKRFKKEKGYKRLIDFSYAKDCILKNDRMSWQLKIMRNFPAFIQSRSSSESWAKLVNSNRWTFNGSDLALDERIILEDEIHFISNTCK